jgi:hypothetical protein
MRGRSNGSPLPPGNYWKLPEYASHTCDIVWLEKERSVVIRDSFVVKDPATIPAYATHMEVTPSRVAYQRLFHCNEQPAVSGNDFSYETPNGQLVRMRRLTADGVTVVRDNGDLVGTHPREDARWPFCALTEISTPGSYEVIHVVSLGEPVTKLEGSTVTVGKTVVSFGETITVAAVVEPVPTKPITFTLTITDSDGKQQTIEGSGVSRTQDQDQP